MGVATLSRTRRPAADLLLRPGGGSPPDLQSRTITTSGTTTDGTFSCTISFPDFAASGQWTLGLEVADVAGNRRWYSRRASDGFLCYWDPTTNTQVCQDFGSTDLILN